MSTFGARHGGVHAWERGLADAREQATRTCRALIERLEAGAISPELALMQALLAIREIDELERALTGLARVGPRAGVERLRRLLREHAPGAAQLAAMLRAERELPGARSPSEQLAACQRLFDTLVAHSEEASVALYSFGSPKLLARASDEIVAFLSSLGVLTPPTRALDLGCGIGRLAQALAPRLAHVDGVDLSSEMVKVARRRCAELPNVRISPCNGRDLAGFGAGSKELALAVDSVPYLVQAGAAVVDGVFAEVARVLAPGGHFVVLNFSYRGDPARDCDDLASLSRRHGFALEQSGERPFRLWDGTAFCLRRLDTAPASAD